MNRRAFLGSSIATALAPLALKFKPAPLLPPVARAITLPAANVAGRMYSLRTMAGAGMTLVSDGTKWLSVAEYGTGLRHSGDTVEFNDGESVYILG